MYNTYAASHNHVLLTVAAMMSCNKVTLLALSNGGKSYLAENLVGNHLPTHAKYSHLHREHSEWGTLEASRLASKEPSSGECIQIDTPEYYFSPDATAAAEEALQDLKDKVQDYKRVRGKMPPRSSLLLATDGPAGSAGTLLPGTMDYGKEFQVLATFQTQESLKQELNEFLQMNDPQVRKAKMDEVGRLQDKWRKTTGDVDEDTYAPPGGDEDPQRGCTLPVLQWLHPFLGKTIMFRSRLAGQPADLVRELLATRDLLSLLQKPSSMAVTLRGCQRLLRLLESLAQQVLPDDQQPAATSDNAAGSTGASNPFSALALEVRRLLTDWEQLTEVERQGQANKLDALAYCITSLRVWVPSEWHCVANLQVIDNLGCGDSSALHEKLRQDREEEATTMLAMMGRVNDATTLDALARSPFLQRFLDAHLTPQAGDKPKLIVTWYMEKEQLLSTSTQHLSIECLFDPVTIEYLEGLGQNRANDLHQSVGKKLRLALQERSITDKGTLLRHTQRLLSHIDFFSCLPLLGQTALRHQEELVERYGKDTFDKALAVTNVARLAGGLLHHSVRGVLRGAEEQASEARQEVEALQRELQDLKLKRQALQQVADMSEADRRRLSVKHKKAAVMRNTLETNLGRGSLLYSDYNGSISSTMRMDCEQLPSKVEQELLLPVMTDDALIEQIMKRLDRHLNPEDDPRAAADKLRRLQHALEPQFKWAHRGMKLDLMSLVEPALRGKAQELEKLLLKPLRDRHLSELHLALRRTLVSYIKAAMRDSTDEEVAKMVNEALPEKVFMAAGQEAFRVVFTPGSPDTHLSTYLNCLRDAWKSQEVRASKQPDIYTALHTAVTSTLQRLRRAPHTEVVDEVRSLVRGSLKEALAALAGAYKAELQEKLENALPIYHHRVYYQALDCPGSAKKTRKTLLYKLFKDTTKAVAALGEPGQEGLVAVEEQLQELAEQREEQEGRLNRLLQLQVDSQQMAQQLVLQSEVAHGLRTLAPDTDIFGAPLPDLDGSSLTMKLLQAGCKLALQGVLQADAAAGTAAADAAQIGRWLPAAQRGATGSEQGTNWAVDQVVARDIKAAFEEHLRKEGNMLKDVSGHGNNCGINAVLSQVQGMDASGSSLQDQQLASSWREQTAEFLAIQVATDPGGLYAAALASEAGLAADATPAEKREVVQQHIKALRRGAYLTYVDMSALVQLLLGNMRVTVYCPLWGAASGYQCVIREPASEERVLDVRLANVPAAWFHPQLGGEQIINHWVVVAPTSNTGGSPALHAASAEQQHQQERRRQQQQQQQARVTRSSCAAGGSSGAPTAPAAPGPAPAAVTTGQLHAVVRALVASMTRGLHSACSTTAPQRSSATSRPSSTTGTKRKAEGASSSKGSGGAPPPKKSG